MRGKIVLVIAVTAILTNVAVAQDSRSSIALEGTGAFVADSSGHDAFDSPTTRHVDTAGGFLVSYRYRLWSWLALEANYGLAPNSIQFSTSSGAFTGNAYMHQVTTGFVVKLPSGARHKFSPYLLMGGGAMIFSPTSDGFRTAGGFASSPAATRETDATFVYGAGVDFPIKPRWSLRAEYRGLVYHSPDFGVPTLATGSTLHTAQPSLGVAYRF
jgi:opacity protein-like surface antigen